MKYLLNHSIYSEGKYPSFVFLDSEKANLFEAIISSPDINIVTTLPSGELDIDMFTATPQQDTNNLSTRIEMSSIKVPIKVGDVNLNDIYLESKDHSKYVKYTWQDLSEEGTEQFAAGGVEVQQFYQRVGEKTDLSWIHYISYRDEDGVFQGNILEFIPIYLALSIANDYDGYGNVSDYTWYDFRSLPFAKPKDNPIDFVWGNLDSTSPGENNPNLFTKLVYSVTEG